MNDKRVLTAKECADRITAMRGMFRERHKLLAALFPENGDTLVARACAVACGLVNTDALNTANVASMGERVIAAHHLGLEIGDQAYLVPYKGDVQLIVGPRGLIALAYRSGFVRSIYATSVFHADVEARLFSYNLATREVDHQKAPSGRRGGADGKPARAEALIDYAYCVIETTTGGIVLEVLTREDIAYYRSFSKASRGPWFDNYEGMCRKTVIKRGLEFVPRSPLLAAALKETETGGYEIPEEMWQQAKLRASGGREEEVQEKVIVGANGAAMSSSEEARSREPGEDG